MVRDDRGRTPAGASGQVRASRARCRRAGLVPGVPHIGVGGPESSRAARANASRSAAMRVSRTWGGPVNAWLPMWQAATTASRDIRQGWPPCEPFPAVPGRSAAARPPAAGPGTPPGTGAPGRPHAFSVLVEEYPKRGQAFDTLAAATPGLCVSPPRMHSPDVRCSGSYIFIGVLAKPMLWWMLTHQFQTSSCTGPTATARRLPLF